MLHPDGYRDATGRYIRGVGILSVCTRGLGYHEQEGAEARFIIHSSFSEYNFIDIRDV
jgi:hypothetical protein